MQPDLQTPMRVFGLPQHLVVPLFQRPYVWNEDDQWGPLWRDVQRMAELRLNAPGTDASHFLGAVVLQAQELHSGQVPALNIIDGQQRLTTLQLLIDAASSVLDEGGQDALADRLGSLTHNQSYFVGSAESSLKLQHSNRDRHAFREVMNAEPPIEHGALAHAESKITRAHHYFQTEIRAWLGEPEAPEFTARANVLVNVLEHGLHLVTITLTAHENSQEIFETLNARGTPLTAADLIRNFVFQRLEIEGADVKRAHSELWPFDTKFWEADVSLGRYFISRSSLFFNQWLVSRLGEDVSATSTFHRFKTFVEHEIQQTMLALLGDIRQQADQYEVWTRASAEPDRQLDPVEMHMYRAHVNAIELTKPILLWLHAPHAAIDAERANRIVAMVESWVVRRLLLRLPTSDMGRIVADIIRDYSHAQPTELTDRVERHLAGLNRAGTYWPGDDEIRKTLETAPVYRQYRRGRLRMILEAIEDQYRSETGEPPVPRRGYPIEHLMPQAWEENWAVDDIEAGIARSEHIHRLGNLTLLTHALNSKVSNGPWPTKVGAFGKHNTLLMTRRVTDAHPGEGWDEKRIDNRTQSLVDTILEAWPVPAGHEGLIIDPAPQPAKEVTIKDLVASGLLEIGTTLHSRPGAHAGATAVVQADGRLQVGDEHFGTPSGAAHHIVRRHRNGWQFWRLEDGRPIERIRAIFRAQSAPGAPEPGSGAGATDPE